MERILPSFHDFVELEGDTLKFLHDRLSQYKILAHASGLVKQCWNSGQPGVFRFGFYWDTDYTGKSCRVFLGADVYKQQDSDRIAHASYCLCIVEGTYAPAKILRKFHFDYATQRKDMRERHPRFHLQYCGGVLPQMQGWGVTNDLMSPLCPEVRGPRIFFRPMTLALLMNIAFHEFPCGDTDEIRNRGEWLNLVRENERVILKPFYSKCADLAGKDGIVFFEQVYVR